MKEICINRDIFNFIVIFSILALVTFGLVFTLVTTSMEFETNEYRETDDGLDGIKKWCYISVVNDEEKCRFNNTVQNRFNDTVFLLSIEVTIIGLWFYTRQNSFKFKFCSSDQMRDKK